MGKKLTTEQKLKRRAERREKRLKRRLRPTRLRVWVIDFVTISVAALFYSFAVQVFTVPYDLAPGGVTGIAIIISSMTGLSVGMLYGLINLPLVVLGFIKLGRRIMIKTLISVVIITFATDYLFADLPPFGGDSEPDLILATICAGVLMGIGLGMIYLRESTSGGVDIINKIIRKKFPHISMGKIMLAMDAVVIALSVIVFGNIYSGLYAAIVIFVCSKMVDVILYGSLEGKLLLIFSDNYEIITERIIKEHNRGVTLLKGVGGYSGKEKNVICCAVQKNQYAKIKRIVSLIDPHAFIVVTNAGEVLGEGFSENKTI